MAFYKYQHVERFGTQDVKGIELGECYVFPKIDGSNGSIWMEDGQIRCGSRNHELTDRDNQGFKTWVSGNDNIREFLVENPGVRLYGEWLVPHSLKTYRDDAWNRFYVFDVVRDSKTVPFFDRDLDSEIMYVPYPEYSRTLKLYGIDFIPSMAVINNGSYEQFVALLEKNTYLIADGRGVGEGIVIKNYGYRNRFGRVVWAKIVTSEFKEKHMHAEGPALIRGKKKTEQEIVDKYVTRALCEKVHSKIVVDMGGWSGKYIPRLLNTVYHDLVKEECWNFIKEHKNPTINFKILTYLTTAKIKEIMAELF